MEDMKSENVDTETWPGLNEEAMLELKNCPNCSKTKLLSEFNRRGEGFQPYCKTCQSEYQKVYAPKRKKKIKQSPKLQSRITFSRVIFPAGVALDVLTNSKSGAHSGHEKLKEELKKFGLDIVFTEQDSRGHIRQYVSTKEYMNVLKKKKEHDKEERRRKAVEATRVATERKAMMKRAELEARAQVPASGILSEEIISIRLDNLVKMVTEQRVIMCLMAKRIKALCDEANVSEVETNGTQPL